MNLRREASFRWLTIAAVGIAIAVRLFGLDFSLWHDEIASVTFARQPVWRLWSDWMIREPNPPLFYTMLHYWMAWFGSTDLAVKSLATVFGIGNVVVVALIARRLGSSWLPALVATLFVGLNPWHIYYSQNARAYTLAAFAASLAGLAVVRIVKQHHDASSSGGARADWMLFGLAMLAALYSHTTMVIFYVVVNLMFASWIAITTRRERLLAPWIASNLMICIGYGWWAWITWHQLGHNGNLAWMDRLNIRLATHIMLEIFAPQSHYLPSAIAALAVLPLALVALTHRWGAALMLLCAGAMLLFYVGSQEITILQERTILWAQPFFAVGLGLAAQRIRHGAVATGLIVVPLALSGLAYREAYPDREWDRWPAVVALAATDPQIPVFVTGEAFALAFGHYCEQRFGNCPIRYIPVRSSEDSPWSAGLSRRMVVDEHRAWSLGWPVIRTVEWDDVDTLFPERQACSAADQSPAYRARQSTTLGQLKVMTWERRADCPLR